ncbi:MAG: type IV pilus assembly protein PilM [bacterium]
MLNDNRILALDIGASSIKIAEFMALKSGGIELYDFGIASVEADQQNEAERLPHIVTAIRDVMAERQIKPGPVLMSVSGQSVFSRFVKLPPVDKEKVYQIILYEAQQNVPFPIEEVVWDYQLIGRGAGELDVMLAAIKADIIVGLTDAVEQAGLVTDLVDVAPMALYNAVRYNYSDLKGCVLVIDIGARSTDLIFMEEGRVFIRSVPVAGNAITQQIMREFELSFENAEEMKKAHAFVAFGGVYDTPKSEVADKVSKIVRGVMTRLHAEINRSINFYRSQQSGRQPSLALLTGGCSVIPYSDTFLKEKLKVDVDYLNPFINLPVNQRIPADEIGRHAHELGQLVGLALRKVLTCPIEVNLLPPRVAADKAFRKKHALLILSGVCAVLVLVVWCGYFFKMKNLADEKLGRVQERVAVLEKVEAPLRQIEADTHAVQGRIENLLALPGKRVKWLQFLASLKVAMPADLWIVQVQPVRLLSQTEAAPAQPGAAPAAVGSITAIDLAGYGYLDKVKSPTPIREFRDAIRAVGPFGADTEITWQPTPEEGDVVRTFKILVTLKEPLAL